MSAAVLRVDETLSWARRSGAEVIIHLRLPDAGLEAGAAGVELVSTDGRLRSTADVTATDGAAEVRLKVPHSELRSSTWQVTVQLPSSTRFVPVEARLLAAPAIPVALLPGPPPSTRMRPPSPRSRPSWARRLAERLPMPLQRVLRRARSTGRAVAGRLR